MDEREMERRGAQIVIGSFALAIGGMLVLFALSYATQGSALAGSGGVATALLMSIGGILLAGWSTYLYRGSVPMVVCCIAIVIAGLVALSRVLAYL